jgi:F0F1-type ATP synthase membrane subunit c/vacuolar-type H+-ATPase subunit K
MDDNISKLLGIAVGLMLCLGAFGTAIHLQNVSSSYLEQVKNEGQRTSLVKQQALNEPLVMEGFELVAAIAHQLRQKDVQLDNADLVFEGSPSGSASYVVDGNGVDAWSKLPLIDSYKHYRISYKITGVGVIEEVICEGIN